jgi:hypothetical protein
MRWRVQFGINGTNDVWKFCQIKISATVYSGEYNVCGVPLSGVATRSVDAHSEERHNHN